MLLFAGNYAFHKQTGIYFINTDLSSEESALLSGWSNEIISFYSRKLQIQFGSKIFYLGATPITKDNVWLFVTYPTIAMVGRKMTMHNLFTHSSPKAVDSSTIPFIAHEIGHYYFGTLLSPNSELKWIFLEGFTEYLNLQFVKEKLAIEAYEKLIRKYSAAVSAMQHITPLNRMNDRNEATEVVKYRYAPLLLIALQRTVGEEKIWQWLHNLLQTKAAVTNYTFFKRSLLGTGVDIKTFQAFEETFFNSNQAIKNLTSAVFP